VTGRRRVLALVAAWAAVVVAVSAVAWSVIGSAGEGVLTSGQPSSLPSAGVPADTPSGTASGTPSGTPSGTSGTSGETPDGTPAGTPSRSPDAATPTDRPPESGVRSWQGAAGTVTARCTGAGIEVVSARPNDGWRVEVDGHGPEEVEVEFEATGDRDGRTKVEGRCVGGTPRFEVELD
jgi:hypothetical protein